MATAYTNYLGSGKRLGLFNITTDLTVNSGSPDQLIDGTTGSSTFWFGSQAVAGKYLEFRIVGSPRIIDKFKIYKQSSTGTQSFKFQGFDGTSWTDLTTFNWPTASGSTEFTFTNTTAYRSYRFLGVSGTITTASLYEVEFSTEAADAYETGNRSASITVTASGITSSGGTVQNLVDGDETTTTTHSWYPSNGASITSSFIIKFALAAAKKILGAKIRSVSNSVGNNGYWKWQGSNDDSTWDELQNEPFLWDFHATGTLTSLATDGFNFFEFPDSYSYYRLVGVSGSTNNTPWYTEVLFDIGPEPTWAANALNYAERAGVLTDGAGSTVRVSAEKVSVLSQGPGSIATINAFSGSVLTSLLPAGELQVDTNAGVYHDEPEFGGTTPIEPIVLESHFTDEDGFDAEINISVGNPFKLKFTDESEYRAMMTRNLSAKYTDDGGFDADMDSLPPPPLQTFLLVSGR